MRGYFSSIFDRQNMFSCGCTDATKSFVFIIVTLGYVFSRQFLMPKINEASDKKNVSDFKKLHRFSVVIFMIQIIIMILVYTQI